jgi:hypothetical protein
MNCAWHECDQVFEPTDPRQEFCCPVCRKARGAWKARRGGPLVDMLLTNNFTGLIEAKARIQKEIADADTSTD